MINKQKNEQILEMSVTAISRKDAKRISTSQHYMKTWPQGSCIYFGVFFRGMCYGVLVLGYSSSTERKIKKYSTNIKKEQYIELQRTWISDKLGHNTESWAIARVMSLLKSMGVWLVLTHSGGCKDDVGFIFQASGWMYFGCDKCEDFYLTDKGEYKNIIASMMYGRVPSSVLKQTKGEIGRYLFGDGEIIKARRHLYLYPIKREIRKRLKKYCLPFPKDPADVRFRQEWITQEAGARGADG